MPSFLLIRHAEAPWSPDNQQSLAPTGQAAAIRLAELLNKEEIEAIYSSPYPRAMQTVAPLADLLGLVVQQRGDLRERELGSSSNATFQTAVAATFSDFEFAHPGGESSRQAQHRVVSLVEALAARHPIRTFILSTHGNLMTLLLNHFDPKAGFELWKSLTFPDVYRVQMSTPGVGTFERLRQPAA